jgi:asparagine synthase (glutamine-hydrolysing)
MSGIGGIFNLDGTSVERHRLERIAGVLRRRGPDGTRIWEGGQIGFVHSHFWATPEELGEEQPISHGRLWLTADARIDNRDDIIPRLGKHLTSSTPSDAELILAAYREWGDNCARFLIGDFAFAIWDEGAHRLFCARDPVGIKMLHYARIGDSLVIGSSTGSVIAALDDLPEVNMPFITDLLAGRYERWVTETPYRGIFRLPPAHSLTADSHGTVLARYWTFGADPQIRLGSDEAYIAHFRELFTEAVRARMRVIGPVGLTVSGGLDSSSIACVANHLVETGAVRTTGFLYSSIFDNTPEADEEKFLDELASRCSRFPVIKILSDDFWGMREFADDNGFPLDYPEFTTIRSLVLGPLRRARGDGCKVVLSGYGGDQVGYSDVYGNPFPLRDVKLRQLPSELRYFRHFFFPLPWRVLAYADFPPLIPKSLIRHLYHLILRHHSHGFLTSSYAGTDQQADFLPPPPLKGWCAQQIYNSVTDGYNSIYRTELDTYAAYAGIDWRFPFFDRRIIDFMIALPPRLCFRKGFSRYILRQSMEGYLPEKIRLRKGKANFNGIGDRGIRVRERDRLQTLIDHSLLVREGLVSPAKLSEKWTSIEKDTAYPSRPLTRFLYAEAWLRHYTQAGSAPVVHSGSSLSRDESSSVLKKVSPPE